MHLHYFQHDHFEDLGFIGDWAASRGFTTSLTRFDILPEFPLLQDIHWLVVLGGEMSVNDTFEFPWLKEEIAFIKEAVQAGKIVIGICLGSQLVAKACESEIFRNKEPEMGFWPVKFSTEASKDSVFRYFPSELTVLHMHFDAFTLPDGAMNMASSEVTNCQAFRLGDKIFAFQFHFEVTPQNIAGFIKEVEPELVEGKYSQTPDEMNALTGCCAANNKIFEKVLEEIYAINK
jgi:GMP synthase-like glutamine amidotransferase